MPFSIPSAANQWLEHYVALLRDSYHLRTENHLVAPELSDAEAAEAIWLAPFVVVAHNTNADPIFTYGNQKALELFECDWKSFTALPSRLSAEAPEQSERDRLLTEVTRRGFIDDYAGIRISSSGRRFRIRQATVWNIIDDDHVYRGQAATFAHWEFL
jgi:hypothetical protein